MSNQQQSTANTVVEEQASEGLLNSIIEQSHVAASDDEKGRARDIIGELVDQIMEGTVKVDKDIVASIDARVAELDKLLSDQLSEVMHAPEFQQLESTWQGLRFLVDNTETSSTLKINVLNARKEELHKDFKMSPDFDQSTLFKKVYEDEYGTFGGSPYSALIGDYEISRNPEDMYFLEEMSHVAAAAHAPFISAASPLLFGLEDYTKMGMPRDMSKLFDTVEYNKWRTFRDSDDARYVGLTLPRVAARLPYGENGTKIESFNFEEDVDGTDHSKYLWMNASYAFASRLTEAFSDFGWTAAIRGVEGGGLVKNLPTHIFKTEDGESTLKCPTEVTITDRRERELSNLGFIPIVHCKNTDYAAFFGANSVQKPAVYNTDAANANAQLSCQLQYIFATSRIAHYLKAIMRDKVGSFGSRQNIEQYLNDWLSQYVLLDDAASPEAKSRFPLREARAEVVEVPGKPGVYKAVAFLRPHYQLDELTLSLRLVAELPQPAGGS